MDLLEIVSTGKALTLSLAAYVLCLFHEDDFVTEGEYNMLQQGLASIDVNALPCVQGTNTRRDPRNDDPIIAAADDGSVTTIFTDYDYAQQMIEQLSRSSTSSMSKFSCTEYPEKASFWLKTTHISNFLSVPSHIRVSSFPYEGGFVRKDLLPLTIRRHCFHHQSSYLKMTDGIINTELSQSPSWWLPCFDLTTEFHLFREDYERRKRQGEMNSWILKPSQGTRAQVTNPPWSIPIHLPNLILECHWGILIPSSQGHVIVTPMMGLRDVAMLAPQLPVSLIRHMRTVCDERKSKEEGKEDDEAAAAAEQEAEVAGGEVASMDGEKVAQLFVTHPLLVHGRKFDIRVYVFVRSFEPFEAYMHTLHYARLANKPYHLTSPDTWIDPEVALTVSAYHPNPSIAAKQSRLTRAALGRQLELEHPGLRYEDMVKSLRSMLRELFQGLSASVGHWPRSSAYYAMDVLFDNHANVCASANANANASANANGSASANASANASVNAGHTHAANTNTDTTTSASNNSNSSDSNSSSNSNSSSSNTNLTPHHFHPPVPKLVEINYMGDWKALKKITLLENEERRARESTRTGARMNPNSNFYPTRDIDSNPDSDSSCNPDSNHASQTKPNSDSKPCSNLNSTTVVEEERVDEVMLEWVEDLLTVLSTTNPPHPDRCIPLHHHNEP